MYIKILNLFNTIQRLKFLKTAALNNSYKLRTIKKIIK